MYGIQGEPIGVYRRTDENTFHFERIVGSIGFRETWGEGSWQRLNSLGYVIQGYNTLYLYMFGRQDFPPVYNPAFV